MSAVAIKRQSQVRKTGIMHSRTSWLQVLTDLHPRYGGISTAVPALARGLAAVAVHAPVAALCEATEQYQPEHLLQGNVHFLPKSRRAWTFGNGAQSSLTSLALQCEGLHVHGLWTPATRAALRAAQQSGRPHCVSAHGMLEPWSLQQSRLRKQIYLAMFEAKVLRRASCLHALTQSEADSYRELVPGVPIAVIPNGVSMPAHIDVHAFLGAYPQCRGKRIVLFLSRLHPKKGIDPLLQAWQAIFAEYADAHLVIAGTGDPRYEAKLHDRVRELGLHSSVTFTGLLQGTLKWSALHTAECFVLPSFSEGFSMAILEALAAGTPVLATTQCNMPDLLHADCGWITQPECESIRNTLRTVLQRSPAANRDSGERGRALVRERYTWTAVASQMAQVYCWLNGAARPEHVQVQP